MSSPPPLPRRPGASESSTDFTSAPPPLPTRPTPPSSPAPTRHVRDTEAPTAPRASLAPLRPAPPIPTVISPSPATPTAPEAPVSQSSAEAIPDASDDGTDSGTDSEREEAYELLASKIAAVAGDQQSIHSLDSARTSKSARLKGLRRRLLDRLRAEEVTHKKDDDSSSCAETLLLPDEDDEGALRAALNDLEDVKVARFLERVGHRVHEVTVAPPRGPIVYPDRASFKRRDGTTDHISFALAYLSTLAAVYIPQSLLQPPPPTKLSLHFLRAEMERVYVLAPPVLAEQLLAGKLSKIWRWESPDTWKWCLVYALLWFTDLLPALPALVLLYLILRARLFPPSASEILAEGREQELRSKEAAELSKQLKSSSRVGLVLGGAARGVMSRVREGGSEQGGALAKALGGGAMLGGGVAGGVKVDAEALERAKRQSAPPSAMARALMGASSTAGGITAGDRFRTDPPSTPPARPTPSLSGSPSTTAPHGSIKREDGSISLYRLVKEMGRVLGPSGQQLLQDGADLGEKTKNILMNPDHPSVTPVILRLLGVLLFLLFTPTWIQIKAAWGYVGIEFFVLWRLRELLPQYRRALLPIWWLLLGAPTDAELATFILQKRSREKRPLRGQKTIRRMARQRARSRVDHSDFDNFSSDDTSELIRPSLSVTNLSTRSRASSFTSIRETSTPGSEEPIGSYFALFNAIPGQLVINSTRIRFSSTRGLRTLSLGVGRLAKKLASRSTAASAYVFDTDSVKSGQSVKISPSGHAIDVSVNDLVGLKKETRYRFEGLVISTRDGEIRLSNVSDRDDAFQKLVSVAPALAISS